MNMHYVTSFSVDDTTYLIYTDEDRAVHLMKMVDIDDHGERHSVMTPVDDDEKDVVIKALETAAFK